MLLEKSREIAPEEMKRLTKWKQQPLVYVSGGESKVWCYKEQYCIGTWNVKSMNQGKLEVVKQEMARVNINILGISELTWTGIGKFNSDDHYIYYCGQESLRRNGVVLTINIRVQNEVLGCSLKSNRMISVRFQGKEFNTTVIQAYAPTTNIKEAETEQFYEDLQDLLELTPKKISFSGYYKQCCDEHWGTCVSFNSGFLGVYAQKWDCWVIR